MIELSGMYEEELGYFLEWLQRRNRFVAFEGAQVLSVGGKGHINVPQRFGPVIRGKRIACVGATYTVPKIHLGNACCPHMSVGKIVSGAPDIVYQGVPVAMFGDRGEHWPGCGTSSVYIIEGINRIPSPVDKWDFSRIRGKSNRMTFVAGEGPAEKTPKKKPDHPGLPGGFTIVAGDD